MKYFLVLVICVLLTGCVGKVYTVVDPKPDSQGRIEGVIIYQPRAVVLEYVTTHLQDERGNIIGSGEERKCTPIPSYEIIYTPDYEKKYAIVYDAALFESTKFSLELDKGVLTKLNSESTSGAKEALDVVQGIIGTAKEIAVAVPTVKATVEKPPCNAGKKIVGRKNIEDIPK
jgi:hypothetical protein